MAAHLGLDQKDACNQLNFHSFYFYGKYAVSVLCRWRNQSTKNKFVGFDPKTEILTPLA